MTPALVFSLAPGATLPEGSEMRHKQSWSVADLDLDERKVLARAIPKFTATTSRDVRVRFGTTPYCPGGGGCDPVTLGIDGQMDVQVPTEGDPSLYPVHTSVSVVNPQNTEFDDAPGHPGGVVKIAQVTASIYEVFPGDVEALLWPGVPLNVFIGVESCATPE